MNCLFEVYKSTNFDKTMVFAVRDDKNSYPHFLIFEDNEWKYVSAKHFLPITDNSCKVYF